MSNATASCDELVENNSGTHETWLSLVGKRAVLMGVLAHSHSDPSLSIANRQLQSNPIADRAKDEAAEGLLTLMYKSPGAPTGPHTSASLPPCAA